MKTDDFNYDLPENLIAQSPLQKRDSSKLMVVDKDKKTIEHKQFNNIIDYLNEDDILVINDTKVIPARLIGTKQETNAVIEILLLKEINKDTYECLAKPAKRIKIGTIVTFSNKLQAECIECKEDGIRIIKLKYEGILLEILEELGDMPLPPYIHEKLEDKDRYQTVYAKNHGSAAAPTAGLHFTNDLLKQIKDKGIKIVPVTLHIGLGTFRPVAVENVLEHKMHSEYYSITKETADILNKAKRIIAVGTTSARTLETIKNKHNTFKEDSGFTDIFIYPGYEFKGLDCLITNFHLPKSTLMMLVSALATKELIMEAYQKAVENQYRFFSFGDSMFIKSEKK